MAKQMFVNLPVKQLDRAVEFFTHLGYQFNPQFTDANATCMIISWMMGAGAVERAAAARSTCSGGFRTRRRDSRT